MRSGKHSVLVVSQNVPFTDSICESLATDESVSVEKEEATFSSLNGRAAEMAFGHDAVIFDADPNDMMELETISTLLKERDAETFFVALTDSEISISKARLLRDAGVDEVLPLSITSDDLKSVIDKNLSDRAAAAIKNTDAASSKGELIAVAQARGGIGATTVAVNLAHSLLGSAGILKKRTTNRVALVDFDIQFGNANVHLDMEDNGGMLNFIESEETADSTFAASIMMSHRSGIDLLCAPGTIAPLHSLRPEQVEALLASLRTDYDYVVVDLPRALVDWIAPVISSASHMLIVSDTSVPCVRQARRLMDFFREEHIGLPIDVIINRDVQPMIKSAHIKEAEAVLETKLKYWLPNEGTLARKAVDLGQPIVVQSPKSKLAKALRKTANQIRSTNVVRKHKSA